MQMYGKGFKKLFENSIFTENLKFKKNYPKRSWKINKNHRIFIKLLKIYLQESTGTNKCD